MRRRSLSPIALLLVLLLAACGGGGGGTSGTERAPLSLAGTVSTVAGRGVSTVAGTVPTFFGVSDVVRVGDFLYATDASNHTIRKIEIATGETTTFAGTGVSGFTDGTGRSAAFGGPTGIASDGTNLYVSANDSIRKIVIATAEVTTLAGNGSHATNDGTGSAARFFSPKGLATDGTNLYVADTGNNRIRKVVISTGVVTSIASGVNGIRIPYGIVTDDGTNLYMTSGDNTIKRMAIATGEVTTLAGTAGFTLTPAADGTGTAARFHGPYGITTDGTNLFVTESGNHTIRKVVISTGEVTTVAGSARNAGYADGTGSAARFSRPRGLTTDGTDLFVADYFNYTVRRVAIDSAEVTTLAGNADASGFGDGIGNEAAFNAPEGVASDGTSLFVADTCNHLIRKIEIATGEVTTLAGSGAASGSADGVGSAARFNFPVGIATDGANLYVADTGNHTIRKVSIATGEVTTIAGIVGEYGSTDGPRGEATFKTPIGVAVVGGELYVADADSHTIRKVALATGEVTNVAGAAGVPGSSNGTGAAATFNRPWGIATDGTNLFVTDSENGTIRKIVIATGAVTRVAGSEAGFVYPQGIVFDGASLYVSDAEHRIRKVAIATGDVTEVAGLAGNSGAEDGTAIGARFYFPTGLATDGVSLFVADCFNNAIRAIR